MTTDTHHELACLAVKIACALPRERAFRHLGRRLALCALAGDRRETLYWLRIAKLARAAPAPLLHRAIALARVSPGAARRAA